MKGPSPNFLQASLRSQERFTCAQIFFFFPEQGLLVIVYACLAEKPVSYGGCAALDVVTRILSVLPDSAPQAACRVLDIMDKFLAQHPLRRRHLEAVALVIVP